MRGMRATLVLMLVCVSQVLCACGHISIEYQATPTRTPSRSESTPPTGPTAEPLTEAAKEQVPPASEEPSTTDTRATVAPTTTPAVGAALLQSWASTNGPALACGTDGVVHVAWADQSSSGPAVLYAHCLHDSVVLTQTVTVASGSSAEARGAPSIAVLPKGGVALAWEEQRSGTWHIAFAYSEDGKRFSEPALVDTAGSGQAVEPSLASASDGTLYLAWREVGAQDQGAIHVARGGSQGRFDKPVAVSPSTVYQATPALAVDQQDHLHVAWTDGRESTLQVYYARSEDGKTFAAAKRVSEGEDNMMPSLSVASDGSLHLAWAHLFARIRAAVPAGAITAGVAMPVYYAMYASSVDGGDTFTPTVNVNDGGSSVSAQPPATAIATNGDGTVYVAFRTASVRDGVVLHYDRRIKGQFGEDSTFAGGAEVGTLSRPAMATDADGNVVLAYGDRETGTFVAQVLRAKHGRTFGPAKASDALTPVSDIIFTEGEPFPAPGIFARGIAHDGQHLWLTGLATDVLEVTEDGKPVAQWGWEYSTRRGDAIVWADGELWGIGPKVLTEFALGESVLKSDRDMEVPGELTKSALHGPYMTWDGHSLWLSHNALVYRIDKDTEEVAGSFVAVSDVTGLACDGTYLWYATGVFEMESQIHVADMDGKVIATFASPLLMKGMVWNAGTLWAVGSTTFNDQPHVYRLNVTEALAYLAQLQE